MLDFLKAVLPPNGPYCVLSLTKNIRRHVAVTDFIAVANKAKWWAKTKRDTYFCLSSLKAPEWIDEKGKRHVRKKENCAFIKTFVLDVDVKADSANKYASKEEALAALASFCSTLELPTPIVVDSGYGLHVYWPLSASIPSQKWAVIANLFKAVAVKLDAKLAVDTTRMADYAGVLRLPGTYNYKNPESPQEVTIIQWSEDTISALDFGKLIKKKFDELKLELPKVRANANSKKVIDLGMDVPHRIEPVFKKCNWAKKYIANIKNTSEPEWYKMLGLVKHLYHPVKSMYDIAQLVSKGHPTYSEEETARKFEQVKAAQSGPTLCETFRNLRPEWCKSCPYASIVKTPAQLDTVDLPDPKPLKISSTIYNPNGEAQQVEIDAIPIPKPYFKGADGGIYMNIDGGDLDGSNMNPLTVKKIYEYNIYPVSRLQNEDSGEEEIEVHLFLPKDGKKVIRIPNQVTIDPKNFAGYLTARGVLLKPHEVGPLVNYMIDYTRVIQKNSQSQGIYTRFGWRNAQEESAAFVLGDGVINNEGAFKPSTNASWLAEQKEFASTKGDIRLWEDAFSAVGKYSPPAYQFASVLGFAAPLLALTPYNGALFNLLGRGGIGKSTALKFMTSIWGKPTMTHILKKDNSIPVFNKIGYLNSMPVAYDEITMLPPDQTADLAYGISEGRGKERAGRDGQTKINFVKWSTFLVCCSNLSLYEKIGASKQGNAAPAYRIFETTVDGVNPANQKHIEAAIRVLNENYGGAGRVYMQYVMQNRKELINKLIETEHNITNELKLRTAERFWGAMFATSKVAIEVCKKIGLHRFNREIILDWAFGEVELARHSLDESQGNALSVISDFINSNLHATLFVSDGKINAYGLSNTPTRELHIRLEKTKGKFVAGYISIPSFKKYCAFNKIEYSWIVKDLVDMRVIKEGHMAKRLGAGTEWGGSPVSALSLDFTSPYLLDDTTFSDIETNFTTTPHEGN